VKSALLCFAGLVVGLLIARVAWPAPPREPAHAADAASAPRDQGVTRAELEAIVRELRADRTSGAATAAATAQAAPLAAPQPATDDESAAPSAEAMTAAADAHDVVERAIASGEWTEGDVEQLRAFESSLTSEDRNLILGALVAAINDQRLTPTTPRLL
jgi:hypothetical protein